MNKEFDNEAYTHKKYVIDKEGGYQSYDTIFKHLKIGGNLLDIGCGDGYFLEKYNKYFFYMKGIEMSKVAVKLCQEKKLNVSLSTIEEFNTFNQFDNILMIDVLEHVNNYLEVLDKVNELLSNKGRLIIVVPNPKGLWVRLNLKENPVLDPAHVYCPEYKILKKALKKKFKLIKSRGTGRLKYLPRLSMGMMFIVQKRKDSILGDSE